MGGHCKNCRGFGGGGGGGGGRGLDNVRAAREAIMRVAGERR